jgi:hypothetical protein
MIVTARRMQRATSPREFLTPVAPFTFEEVEAAATIWGANCGPGALAAVLGRRLEEIRPHLGDFECKRYTNPRLMFAALRSLGVDWRVAAEDWPDHGLIRVQWEGPWTAPGVPMRARYRQTHWIGSRTGKSGVEIFDINCMSVGGWVHLAEWRDFVVPWLLRDCHPKANGRWHCTHRLAVRP